MGKYTLVFTIMCAPQRVFDAILMPTCAAYLQCSCNWMRLRRSFACMDANYINEYAHCQCVNFANVLTSHRVQTFDTLILQQPTATEDRSAPMIVQFSTFAAHPTQAILALSELCANDPIHVWHALERPRIQEPMAFGEYEVVAGVSTPRLFPALAQYTQDRAKREQMTCIWMTVIAHKHADPAHYLTRALDNATYGTPKSAFRHNFEYVFGTGTYDTPGRVLNERQCLRQLQCWLLQDLKTLSGNECSYAPASPPSTTLALQITPTAISNTMLTHMSNHESSQECPDNNVQTINPTHLLHSSLDVATNLSSISIDAKETLIDSESTVIADTFDSAEVLEAFKALERTEWSRMRASL